MPLISRPQKSNDLHNDLTSPANQMLAFSALTESTSLTSVHVLVNEMLKSSSTINPFLTDSFIHPKSKLDLNKKICIETLNHLIFCSDIFRK